MRSQRGNFYGANVYHNHGRGALDITADLTTHGGLDLARFEITDSCEPGARSCCIYLPTTAGPSIAIYLTLDDLEALYCLMEGWRNG